LNNDMLLYIKKISNEFPDGFSTDDFVIINALFLDQKIPQNLKNRMKRLVEMGIIEHVSRDKYVLARGFYEISGRSGTRTRLVGLDRETNKELLYKHIKDNGDKGTPFNELQQVLPGHSRSQVQILLRELRTEGRIFVTGSKKGALWFIFKIK